MSAGRDELLADLVAHAPRYHFVQAVRILEAALGQAVPSGGGRPEVEGIRFSGSRSLSFAPADIEGIAPERGPGGEPRYRITSRFLSLLGASCVLPHAYTERLRGEVGDDEPPALGFVDLLHHRLHSLAFQVLTRSRPFEDRAHPLYRRAATLAGLGGDHGLRPEAGELGGLIGPRPRGPKALEQAVRRYFGVPCTVRPLLDVPLPVPPQQRSVLGTQAHRLRAGAMLGRRRRQPRRTFGVEVGPLPAERARDFLPEGARYRELRALIGRFDRDGLHCQVTVAMDGASLPAATLDRTSRLDRRVRLGGRPQRSYDARFVIAPATT